MESISPATAFETRIRISFAQVHQPFLLPLVGIGVGMGFLSGMGGMVVAVMLRIFISMSSVVVVDGGKHRLPAEQQHQR